MPTASDPRKTFRVSPEDAKLLAQTAKRLKVSEAEVFRKGLRALQPTENPKPSALANYGSLGAAMERRKRVKELLHP